MLLVGVPRVRMCTVVILWVSDLLGGIAAVVALCVPEDTILCTHILKVLQALQAQKMCRQCHFHLMR